MARLLIVHHSPTDTTRQMSDAVLAGAKDGGDNDIRSLGAFDAGPDDLLWCDGFILGTTENFGYMSGALKDFLDRSYYPCENSMDGKPFALFVRAGNDGQGALSSMRRILTGLKVREVQEPVLIVGPFDASRLEDCRTLGMTLSAGLEAGVF